MTTTATEPAWLSTIRKQARLLEIPGEQVNAALVYLEWLGTVPDLPSPNLGYDYDASDGKPWRASFVWFHPSPEDGLARAVAVRPYWPRHGSIRAQCVAYHDRPGAPSVGVEELGVCEPDDIVGWTRGAVAWVFGRRSEASRD